MSGEKVHHMYMYIAMIIVLVHVHMEPNTVRIFDWYRILYTGLFWR